jgi:ApaG protein
MSEESTYEIEIRVETAFLEEDSAPDDERYVFSYTIRICNSGSVGARLLNRHWVITDANGKVQEVRGDGVVGEQPWLQPGECFEYTSGAILETSVGTMQGSYGMIGDDGIAFEANIPPFILAVPRTLH